MVVLGLGTNCDDRIAFLGAAIKALTQGRGAPLRNGQISGLYKSDALLLEGSPPEWDMPFLNLAVSGETDENPQSLLSLIKQIEKDVGRQERGVWAPREIDIDILYWDGVNQEEESLTIPHPGMADRPFALLPAAELVPSLTKQHPLFHQWAAEAAYPRKLDLVPSQTRIASVGEHLELHNWLKHQGVSLDVRVPRPEIVGILNATPDSFSDGGAFNEVERATAQVHLLFQQGASIIDIGAESTRPGAASPSVDREISRLRPILDAFRMSYPAGTQQGPQLSIDTRHVAVVRAVAEYQPDWINDVSGGDCPELVEEVAKIGCRYVVMHHLGVPPQKEAVIPENADCLGKVLEWIFSRTTRALELGVSDENIIVDPGIGFGKTEAQSFEILRRAAELKQIGYPVLIGHSRKSFLNGIVDKPFADRDLETAVLSAALPVGAASFLRVHNAEIVIRALRAKRAVSFQDG